MEKTATNQNNFPEKKFAISATKRHIEKFGEQVFVREQALPNLYRQATFHFGNEFWYTIHFDSYFEGDFYNFVISCQAKPQEKK